MAFLRKPNVWETISTAGTLFSLASAAWAFWADFEYETIVRWAAVISLVLFGSWTVYLVVAGYRSRRSKRADIKEELARNHRFHVRSMSVDVQLDAQDSSSPGKRNIGARVDRSFRLTALRNGISEYSFDVMVYEPIERSVEQLLESIEYSADLDGVVPAQPIEVVATMKPVRPMHVTVRLPEVLNIGAEFTVNDTRRSASQFNEDQEDFVVRIGEPTDKALLNVTFPAALAPDSAWVEYQTPSEKKREQVSPTAILGTERVVLSAEWPFPPRGSLLAIRWRWSEMVSVDSSPD